MKLKLYLAVFAFLPLAAYAQPYMEVGVMGGVANYYGDLTQDYVVINESKPAYGGFVKLNINDNYGIKLNVNHGKIGGADSHSNRATQLLRNLSFNSDVTEVAITFEYAYPGTHPKGFAKMFSPYIYAGIGGFHYNPEAFFEGQWYDLQPLGTEGQGLDTFDFRQPYSLYSLCIPFGLGVKWSFTERWNLGLEYGARWTFTDYLDDISRTYVDRNILIEGNGIDAYNLSNRTGEALNGEPFQYGNNVWRGDPSNKDWYMWFGVTLSRNLIKGTAEGFKTNEKAGMGCPGADTFKRKKPKSHKL